MEAEQSPEVVGNDIGKDMESTYEDVIVFDHVEDVQKDVECDEENLHDFLDEQ